MAKKTTWYLEYRYYKEDHWTVYDHTQVDTWADTQYERMQKDHPGAEYRKVPR